MASLQDFKPLDEVTVDGRVYVDKEQLMALIKEEKRLSMEGTEPGYMMPKKKQRIAAMLALNHLATLLRKREMDEMKSKDPYYLVAKLSEETGVFLLPFRVLPECAGSHPRTDTCVQGEPERSDAPYAGGCEEADDRDQQAFSRNVHDPLPCLDDAL